MAVSDPTVGLPLYHDGEIVLTGFSTDDYQSIRMRFSVDYIPWGSTVPDDFVQNLLDYLAASPNVASLVLKRSWPTDTEMTPTP